MTPKNWGDIIFRKMRPNGEISPQSGHTEEEQGASSILHHCTATQWSFLLKNKIALQSDVGVP
jgi:hypothetical protein